MTLSELINEIISEWGCRVDDGMPNPKNPQHLKELRDVLEVMGLSSIKNELIENLLEGDTFKNPALNKVVRYKDVHGEDAEGKVGNLMRRPSEEDAHQKAVSTLGGKDSDRYKEAMNDLGGEGQPKKKDEKEGGSEDGTPSVTATAFDPNTAGGKDYIDSLPDTDPASEEEITELLEAFFGEDVETLTEGSFLKPEYKVGHQIIFSKENPPKWAPELKNGDVLTIVVDDDRIIPHGEGEFVKTLQLPNGKLVRVADKNVGGGESKKFKHLKKGASAAAPSGEDWEA
jgi:hypothetical protein